MPRRARLLALVLAPAALLGAGLAAPALAASAVPPSVTVAGSVVDADGHPVRGVSMMASRGSKQVFLGATNDDGVLRAASSSFSDDELSAASWYISYLDSSDDYATVTHKVALHSGVNDLGVVSVEKGGHATGTITSPSGLPVRHAYVEYDAPITSDQGWVLSATTADDGTFDLGAINLGTQTLGIGFDNVGSGWTGAWREPSVTFDTPGQVVGGLDYTMKTPVTEKISLTGGKKKATVKMSVNATYWGIPTPGGKVSVYAAGKLKKTFTVTSNGTRTMTITGLKKGRRTLSIRYSGGPDTTSLRLDRTVTVK